MAGLFRAGLCSWFLPGSVVLALFLFNAPDAHAQGTGAISVRVSDEAGGEPVVQAEVQLMVFGRGMFSHRGFTDSAGRVIFPGVGPGGYYLEVKHPDYEPVREDLEAFAGLTSNVFLRMRRKPDRPRPQPAAGSTPATSLSAPPKARKELEDGRAALRTDVPRSLAHFRKAIELHPKYAEAYAWLGFALIKEKKDGEAMEALDKAIEIDARLSLARALRGRLLVEQSQLARAEEDLKEAVALDPLAWDAHYDLARVYAVQNQLDLALTHAQRAHDVPQAPPAMHLLLHDIYTRRNDFVNALKELEDFVKADPKSPQIPRVQQRIEELKKKS